MTPETTDRDRGILTQGDREYLMLSVDARNEEYTPQARYARHTDITQRAADALLDQSLLAEAVDAGVITDSTEISDRARERIAEADDEPAHGTHLVESIQAQIRLAYEIADATDLLDADAIAEDALEQARNTRVDALREKYEASPGDLTLSEIRTLADAGAINLEEQRNLMSGVLDRPIGNVGMGEVDESVSEEPDSEGSDTE